MAATTAKTSELPLWMFLATLMMFTYPSSIDNNLSYHIDSIAILFALIGLIIALLTLFLNIIDRTCPGALLVIGVWIEKYWLSLKSEPFHIEAQYPIELPA